MAFFQGIHPARWLKTLRPAVLPKAPRNEAPDRVAAPAAASNAPGADSSMPALTAADSLSPQLGSAAEAVMAACRSCDSDFLEIGRQLQAVYGEASTLTEKITGLLADSEDGQVRKGLDGIRHQSAQAVGNLDQTRTQLQADVERIAAVDGDLTDLIGKGGAFRQIAKTLKMVGLNITIESAHTVAARETFSALAEEIKALSATVFEVAEHIRDDTAHARAILAAIHAEMQAGDRQLTELAAGARQTVAIALDKAGGFVEASLDLMNATGRTATAVAEQVAEVVVSVQVHDSITQRAQHVHQALAEADWPAQTPGTPQADPDAVRRLCGTLCIQERQLDCMAADIDDTQRRGQAAFVRLGELIDGLAEQSGTIFGRGATVCAGAGHEVITELRHALNELLGLLDHSTKGIQRLTAAKKQTTATIDRLTHYIDQLREVNFDIHLKALNAIVKSTRLGDQGKGIEVLVLEMKELADQSNHFINQVTAILEKISALNVALNRDIANGAGGESAGDRLRSEINHFTEVCQAFEQRSAEAYNLSGQLQNRIADTRRFFDFFTAFSAAISAARTQVRAVIAGLGVEEHLSGVPVPLHEQVSTERYTMQKERDIHHAVLGSATISGVENRREDGFDNVELF